MLIFSSSCSLHMGWHNPSAAAGLKWRRVISHEVGSEIPVFPCSPRSPHPTPISTTRALRLSVLNLFFSFSEGPGTREASDTKTRIQIPVMELAQAWLVQDLEKL